VQSAALHPHCVRRLTAMSTLLTLTSRHIKRHDIATETHAMLTLAAIVIASAVAATGVAFFALDALFDQLQR
jgi:hypothetical protein